MGIDDEKKNLFGLLGAIPPTTRSPLGSPMSPALSGFQSPSIGGLLAALLPYQPERTNPLAGVAPGTASVLPPFGSPAPHSVAETLFPTPAPRPAIPVTKRKAFFSFHFDDIMRVNVVRNAWKIAHPENTLMRSFYDSSLWERRKLEGDEAVKRLIREGVCYTSAVCVLVGSETWLRRWVKYEVARAIIDGQGLLAVHLNSIRHHQTKTTHARGPNPLDFIAIGKACGVGGPRYYLFEKLAKPNGLGGYGWEWHHYEDYTYPVERPSWVSDPPAGYVTPLSENADLYDFIADHGHKNFGVWIDRAARRAGR